MKASQKEQNVTQPWNSLSSFSYNRHFTREIIFKNRLSAYYRISEILQQLATLPSVNYLKSEYTTFKSPRYIFTKMNKTVIALPAERKGDLNHAAFHIFWNWWRWEWAGVEERKTKELDCLSPLLPSWPKSKKN